LYTGFGGFTLVELMVTVSIISILVAIGIASYSSINKRSRDTKRKSDLEQVRSALEMYRAENGYYPSTGAGSETDVSNLTGTLSPTFIPALPLDPSNTSPYLYQYQATGLSGGNYYGYCLFGTLETQDPSDSCSPPTGFNYGVKNP